MSSLPSAKTLGGVASVLTGVRSGGWKHTRESVCGAQSTFNSRSALFKGQNCSHFLHRKSEIGGTCQDFEQTTRNVWSTSVMAENLEDLDWRWPWRERPNAGLAFPLKSRRVQVASERTTLGQFPWEPREPR